MEAVSRYLTAMPIDRVNTARNVSHQPEILHESNKKYSMMRISHHNRGNYPIWRVQKELKKIEAELLRNEGELCKLDFERKYVVAKVKMHL